MSLAVIRSCSLQGVLPHAVQIEVHVGPGLPAFNIVGLPDTGVRESRERVRAAIISSGYSFPAARITVNLAPADLPKEAGHFDLAIALGVLLASGQLLSMSAPAGERTSTIYPVNLDEYTVLGALSLTGAICAIRAPLALAVGLQQLGAKAVIAPQGNAAEMAWVEGLDIYGVSSLSELVTALGAASLKAQPRYELNGTGNTTLCMSEVVGQSRAKQALEIAAAGGHNVLLKGSPGVGKSMLAQRFVSILPPLSNSAMLEVAAIHGVAGQQQVLSRTPPFRSPHHSCTSAALVGGGIKPRPGEITLAHHGVLFLDELTEFARPVLESLREPLEAGSITVARAARSIRFPARFQLIAAMNPCPCGWYGHPAQNCRCSPQKVEHYIAKLSGPLLERIDMHLALYSEEQALFSPSTSNTEPSATIQQRVATAQQLQKQRQGCLNAQLNGTLLQQVLNSLTTDAQQLLVRSAQKWVWSMRTVLRLKKVARTVADLQQSATVELPHIAQAIQYRL